MAKQKLNDLISELVRGNHRTIRRTIELDELAAGESIASAIMTVKIDPKLEPDADAVWQKSITLVDNPGTGHVETAGLAPGTDAVVRFDLVPADTFLLIAGKQYVWDIKTTTSLANRYTPNKGKIQSVQDVTRI